MNNLSATVYTITNTKNTIKINPANGETHKRVLKILQTNGIDYHTFTPKNELNKPYLLRGLAVSTGITAENIKNILTEHGFIIIDVRKFETGYSRNNNKSTGLWLVIFHHKTDEKKILEYDCLCNTNIKFVPFKRRGAVQCKRCQRFMHTAANCRHPYRCVKCGESHQIGLCELGENAKLKCANCKGQHSANNLGECDFFKNEILPLSRKNQLRSITKPKGVNKIENVDHNTRDRKQRENTKKQTQQNHQQENANGNNDEKFDKLLKMFESLEKKVAKLANKKKKPNGRQKYKMKNQK